MSSYTIISKYYIDNWLILKLPSDKKPMCNKLYSSLQIKKPKYIYNKNLKLKYIYLIGNVSVKT